MGNKNKPVKEPISDNLPEHSRYRKSKVKKSKKSVIQSIINDLKKAKSYGRVYNGLDNLYIFSAEIKRITNNICDSEMLQILADNKIDINDYNKALEDYNTELKRLEFFRINYVISLTKMTLNKYIISLK